MTRKDIAGRLAEIIEERKPDKIFVITDSNVDVLTRGFLPDFSRIVIPAGEENKNIITLSSVWEELTGRGATRKSLVINLGGGLVTDLGGFAAATFKRGIDYGNIPTTLLAAVDAAIGGKTGINFSGFKNEIGAFRMPLFTFPLVDSFTTLPKSELLSGYGEMLKTALLMDREAYNKITDEGFLNIENAAFRHYVLECGKFKEKIVEKDPTEKGLRKILNLGHTFGHAFESLLLNRERPVSHGIAVAHGLLASLVLSRLVFDSEPALLYRFTAVLKAHFPTLPLRCDDIEQLLQIMGHDKKNFVSGTPRFVLLPKIGEPVYDVEVKREDIVSAYEIYCDLSGVS